MMMHRQIIATFALVSFFMLLWGAAPTRVLAQNVATTAGTAKTSDKRRFEVGLNVSSTLSAVLGNGFGAGPDIVVFKWIKNNKGLRTGFNINLTQQSLFDPNIGGNRNTRDFGISLRAGYEKRHELSQKFKFFWGIDGLLQNNNSEVSFLSAFSGSEIKTNSLSIGAGPVAGIMFDITPRMSLATETALYLLYTYQSERTISFPLDNTSTSDNINLLHTLPTSIYFIARF